MKYAFFVSGTNTTYLSNTVNKYFGCNLRVLVNKYRVLYAKQLLVNGFKSYKDIASLCGFASRSVFYTSFLREVGMAPRKYCSVVLEKEVRLEK